MDIVFVRHAEAVERRPELDDLSRELTPKGRKEVGDSVLRLKKHLEPGKRILIWTSPAARASQTAQIIADALEIKSISSFEWVYTGDFEAFCDALSKVDDKTTLFVVGHMPHLSVWGEQLCGAVISFKKGAMAGLELSSKTPSRAELRWLLRASVPKDPAVSDRSDQHITITDYQGIMIRILSDISERRNQFLREPDDVEHVHQMRVSIRKARSLLSFIKPALDGEEYRSIQAALKSIVDRLSYIREIDVLLEQLRSFQKKDKRFSSRKALAGLLINEREKEKSALHGYLSDDSISVVLDGIASWIQQWDDQEPARFESFALKRFAKWNQDIANALKALDDDDHAKMHSLRIKLKKLHNVQDNIRLPRENTGMELPELKLLQRDLGEICDTYASVSVLLQLGSVYGVRGLSEETGIFTAYLLSLREELKAKFILTKARLSHAPASPGASHEAQ